jgi:hypothetical protein
MYFGLPYIHAVFDVAAWLALMAVFWLTTRQPRAASRPLRRHRGRRRAL